MPKRRSLPQDQRAQPRGLRGHRHDALGVLVGGREGEGGRRPRDAADLAVLGAVFLGDEVRAEGDAVNVHITTS